MNERQKEALAALTPEQQAAVLKGHQEWVAERELARREALQAHIDRMPCCQDHNRYGEIRARRWDFEWQLELCPQCRQWQEISWMIHASAHGMPVGDVDAA